MAVQRLEATSTSLGIDRRQAVPAALGDARRPVLLLVIDTEEEFDWSRPFSRDNRGVTAIRGLVRAQRMFEELGLRPTYVVDHPVASAQESADLLASFASRGAAEIGAHLHPWVTPPDEEAVSAFNSYGGNLPPALERAKLATLRDAIVAGIGVRPATYKAGRYGIGSSTIRAIGELGFTVDLSTTPGYNWSGDGGGDFTGYPNDPYWLPGDPPILEIPTTGGYFGPLHSLGASLFPAYNSAAPSPSATRGLLKRLRLARQAMLTPEGFRLWELKALTEALLSRGTRVFTLSLHSPSTCPGHTPFVRSEHDLEEFLGTIAAFARWFEVEYSGRFLTASETRAAMRAPAS